MESIQEGNNLFLSRIAIFSDDDPHVPIDNKEDFADKLGSKIIIKRNKGHFTGSTGTKELPVALDAVIAMAGE